MIAGSFQSTDESSDRSCGLTSLIITAAYVPSEEHRELQREEHVFV
jgi:hypothetical protein